VLKCRIQLVSLLVWGFPGVSSTLHQIKLCNCQFREHSQFWSSSTYIHQGQGSPFVASIYFRIALGHSEFSVHRRSDHNIEQRSLCCRSFFACVSCKIFSTIYASECSSETCPILLVVSCIELRWHIVSDVTAT
jgi:hypothetical protein